MSESNFWSRRRAAVAEEARSEEEAMIAAQQAKAEAELSERDDAEILEELGLPEPETLESPEAVREFLNSAIPQRLKTRALRRLWRLNPVLANLDGLVDYGEDFTDSATVIENLQTAYQVGKGMLAHVEALAAKAEATEETAEEAAPAETPEQDEPIAVETPVEEDPAPIVALSPEQPEDAYPVEEELAEMPAPARRMRFQFEAPA